MNLYTKNLAKVILVLIAILMTLPLAVNAQGSGGIQTNTQTPPGGSGGIQTNTTPPAKTFTLKNPLKVDSIGGLVSNFIEIFSYLVILLAVLALIWVGLQFILARGDPGKMTELKAWLFWIVVGVAVVIGARVIIQVIINTLESTGTVDKEVIRSVDSALKPR